MGWQIKSAMSLLGAQLLSCSLSSTGKSDEGFNLKHSTTSCLSEDHVEAYCDAAVIGVGFVDTENDYLPHVIACENGNASPASLRAQAIAARSYLYYRMNIAGVIEDGPREQVYTCGRQPSEEHHQAVEDTNGVVLRYQGSQVAAFYVAGAEPMPPSCEGNKTVFSKTEKFVTYNEGNMGDALKQSSIGLVDANNLANRGCMSQHGANCLASSGSSTRSILNFYYGDDIELHQALGECVEPLPRCQHSAVASNTAKLETNLPQPDSSVL